MPVIKRYPNRKLYDTEAKRYITLNGIAQLIQEGAELQVVDHVSGEDLTAVTLTQVILEQEKTRSGFVPKSVLAGLVQAGGDTLNSLRRGLASPLDLLRHVDEEIESRLMSLVSRGELARDEGLRLRDQLLGLRSGIVESELEEFLRKRGVLTRDELRRLTDQLDHLVSKVDQLIAK